MTDSWCFSLKYGVALKRGAYSKYISHQMWPQMYMTSNFPAHSNHQF